MTGITSLLVSSKYWESVWRKQSLGCLGFFKKWTNNFKLVSKLVSNRTCSSPAVPFMWVRPVENLTIKTYPKFWLGYGSVGTAQVPKLPLDWGAIKPQWSVENYSMFQRKVFEHRGIKLTIATTLPSFGKRLLFTICIQCTAKAILLIFLMNKDKSYLWCLPKDWTMEWRKYNQYLKYCSSNNKNHIKLQIKPFIIINVALYFPWSKFRKITTSTLIHEPR